MKFKQLQTLVESELDLQQVLSKTGQNIISVPKDKASLANEVLKELGVYYSTHNFIDGVESFKSVDSLSKYLSLGENNIKSIVDKLIESDKRFKLDHRDLQGIIEDTYINSSGITRHGVIDSRTYGPYHSIKIDHVSDNKIHLTVSRRYQDSWEIKEGNRVFDFSLELYPDENKVYIYIMNEAGFDKNDFRKERFPKLMDAIEKSIDYPIVYGKY